MITGAVTCHDWPSLVRDWVDDLMKERPFVLFLVGDLGSGKTTFTKALIEELQGSGVQSPTFSYLNEYRTKHGLIAHLDLYRWDASRRIENLVGLEEYRGFIVEWPDSFLEYLRPTHRLTLSFSTESDQREYRFENLAQLDI